MEVVHVVIAIAGFIILWTTTVIGGVIWLSGRFRSLEKTIYREMDQHRREDIQHFTTLGQRMQRLELKEFGFTQSPP